MTPRTTVSALTQHAQAISEKHMELKHDIEKLGAVRSHLQKQHRVSATAAEQQRLLVTKDKIQELRGMQGEYYSLIYECDVSYFFPDVMYTYSSVG